MTFLDFVRKVMYVISRELSMNVFRRLKAYYYFKSFNVNIAHNVKAYGQIYKVIVGTNISISSGCIFEFSAHSILRLGSNVYIAPNTIIACRNSIIIGDDVQIGENTSIRDSTHDYRDYGLSIKFNKDIVGSIKIGNNVWIGRGCLILPDTTIEDGVVIGANSIIKGFFKSNGIYAGCPAKFIKNR